jgi:hypothetical protein
MNDEIEGEFEYPVETAWRPQLWAPRHAGSD